MEEIAVQYKQINKNFKEIMNLNTDSGDVTSKLINLQRIRCKIRKNINTFQRKNLLLSSLIISGRKQQRQWKKFRTGKFWEKEVPTYNDDEFKEVFRMRRDSFNLLCSKLSNLRRMDTAFRKCILLEKRVAIALYALASSAEYRSIGALFGVGKSTVCNLVQQFCKEIWRVLKPEFLSYFPLTRDTIKDSVEGFELLGFPQCLGALDGCHIEVRPHKYEACDYFNYKGWYSIVLLALVDYRYRFLYVNVGSPGRCNDSSIYESSLLKKELEKPILKEMSREINGVKVPVLILGDSAFRFSTQLMKPYPFNTTTDPIEKGFNKTLSSSRRVVENAFGHLKARFRRIGKGLDNSIEHAALIIKSCCVLHNFLNAHNEIINETWMEISKHQGRVENGQPAEADSFNDHDPTPKRIREAIALYIAGTGDTPEAAVRHGFDDDALSSEPAEVDHSSSTSDISISSRYAAS